MTTELQQFLEKKVKEYNRPSFIENDPVCVPHSFTQKQDMEIAGFFAAIFAWGNRTTIINKTKELMQLMDNAPHSFCLHHTDEDLKKLLHFKHRTFNPTDLLYFISFFKMHYSRHESLETAFSQWMKKKDVNTENALNGFYNYFFSLNDVPDRTLKHIASPNKNSTCKRLSMYLRWMVRNDGKGVDFGLWKKISPAQLIVPLDVHVARVARHFNLINRKPTDWLTAVELTEEMKAIDPKDPCKFDFALFALGVLERF
ncbi:TIGR02757 family protein [Ferruginibacter sp. HRS2-29]|uniref:TIGR02757 family protein n=1 Tax=Ferruginibacter sp. HRS2-29 TaxID=2487334 RepID=UPI0020CDC618|nr:TIGR02757 family protein [Ferruginibacter sp. HRS2-29]MCP9751280.1 TIGR02757 family protein [Ferruginibacter sp. HRS2-29]